MIETLNNFDTQLFYLINGHHCTAMDWVMWVFTARWSWIIVIVAAFCFSTLRHEPRKWWIVLAGIALCFLLADQGSVSPRTPPTPLPLPHSSAFATGNGTKSFPSA